MLVLQNPQEQVWSWSQKEKTSQRGRVICPIGNKKLLWKANGTELQALWRAKHWARISSVVITLKLVLLKAPFISEVSTVLLWGILALGDKVTRNLCIINVNMDHENLRTYLCLSVSAAWCKIQFSLQDALLSLLFPTYNTVNGCKCKLSTKLSNSWKLQTHLAEGPVLPLEGKVGEAQPRLQWDPNRWWPQEGMSCSLREKLLQCWRCHVKSTQVSYKCKHSISAPCSAQRREKSSSCTSSRCRGEGFQHAGPRTWLCTKCTMLCPPQLPQNNLMC